MTRSACRAVVCLPLILAAGTSGQERPMFRAATECVAMDAVVTDNAGKFIDDLSAQDFRVLDNGLRQQIVDFRRVVIPLLRRDVAAAGQRPELSVDVATNVPAAIDGRTFVIVIDELHIVESDVVPLKEFLNAFLTTLQSQDDAAIVFVGRSDLGQNFTTDLGRLSRTLEGIRAALGFGLDARPLTGRSRRAEAQRNARAAVAALRNVADVLAESQSSRRAILFVSGGFLIDPDAPAGQQEHSDAAMLRDDLADLFRETRRAGVPIYTIDPRGQVLPEDAVRGGIGSIADSGARQEIARRIRIQQGHLVSLAVNTGGKALINQSDMRRAAAAVAADNAEYYRLGFCPGQPSRGVGAHMIEIEVDRPDVKVRSRSGFVAGGEGTPGPDIQSQLSQAMRAAFDRKDLALRVVAVPVSHGPKGISTVVTVQVTYPLPVEGSGRIDDALLINVAALDSDGRVSATSGRTFTVRATPRSVGTATFLVNDVIQAPFKDLTLRVGVASRTLGRLGTVHVNVSMPGSSGESLHLGGPALGITPMPEPALGTDLIKALMPFQPTTTRAFAQADELRVLVPAFWRSRPEEPEVTIAIEGDRTYWSVVHKVRSWTERSGRRSGVIEATAPLKDLPRGSYTLRVTGVLGNRRAAPRAVSFTVR